MIHWPADSVFVMVGGTASDLSSSSSPGADPPLAWEWAGAFHRSGALSAGAELRRRSNDWHHVARAENQELEYSAGASNKRFEYAALGIAQVTNAGPGMEEIFGDTGIASLLETVNPESIGREIARLLSIPLETCCHGRARASRPPARRTTTRRNSSRCCESLRRGGRWHREVRDRGRTRVLVVEPAGLMWGSERALLDLLCASTEPFRCHRRLP